MKHDLLISLLLYGGFGDGQTCLCLVEVVKSMSM